MMNPLNVDSTPKIDWSNSQDDNWYHLSIEELDKLDDFAVYSCIFGCTLLLDGRILVLRSLQQRLERVLLM